MAMLNNQMVVNTIVITFFFLKASAIASALFHLRPLALAKAEMFPVSHWEIGHNSVVKSIENKEQMLWMNHG